MSGRRLRQRFQLKCGMVQYIFPADAFGDRFELEALPLPRAALGYAVQMLDTDTVLDHHSDTFMPVRSTKLQGLFGNFDDAYSAAKNWAERNCANPASTAWPLCRRALIAH